MDSRDRIPSHLSWIKCTVHPTTTGSWWAWWTSSSVIASLQELQFITHSIEASEPLMIPDFHQYNIYIYPWLDEDTMVSKSRVYLVMSFLCQIGLSSDHVVRLWNCTMARECHICSTVSTTIVAMSQLACFLGNGAWYCCNVESNVPGKRLPNLSLETSFYNIFNHQHMNAYNDMY